jgi:CubicO group peptidase (beta-lactamase class C family)
VDAFVLAEMARQHIPGLALAVIQAGKVVKVKGYGFADIKRREPVRPDTVFRIGSMSKQFLATGIMLLAQEGKLTVDDPISKYFTDAPASWSAITLRHFLNHTSGVVREGPAYEKHKVQPDRVVVQSAYALPLKFPPGEKFSYCNVCYFALADVIAQVSGTPWDMFMTKRVFAPQGMTSTRTATKDPGPGGANGYFWDEKSPANDPRYTVADENTALRPSGAFVSTVLDLAKWDAALYRDDVLARVSREAMWTPIKLPDDTWSLYGFGWFLGSFQGRRWVSHGGSVNGFQSVLTRFPEDSLTVIVLTNGDRVDPDAVADPISHAYLPTVVPLAAAELEQFVGTYDVQLEDNRVVSFRVFTRDGQLFSQVEGRPEIPLRYLGGSEFGADIDWSRRVKFLKDGGVVTGMSFTQKSLTHSGPRRNRFYGRR